MASTLPRFTDHYLQHFNPRTKAMEVRRKSQAGGNLTLLQTIELIEDLLVRHQSDFRNHQYDTKLILFPFLYIEPSQGDRILNITTGETYTVDQIIKNPSTDKWEGLIRLNAVVPPSWNSRHVLKFVDSKNYVNFVHTFPTIAPNTVGANTSGEGLDPPPMKPTISWFLSRKEPGSITGDPFGPRKELKPRRREQYKDTMASGYTVTVFGQWFDNVVQFDALYVNNTAVEQLVEWFELFMRLHTWILRERGLVQVFFWRRIVDKTDTQWRQPIWIRSVQYYFRTEQLEARYERDLLKLDIITEVTTNALKLTPHNVSPRFIADQLVSGELSELEYRALFHRSGQYLFGDTILQQ